MAIMITGGTGFLGSYLARHLLLEKGVAGVVLFDRYPDLRKLAGVEDRATVVEGDVLEPQELLAAMDRHRVERVVHLAFGVGGPAREKIVPYARVQTMGTANVFEAARLHGAVRVVNASSLAVYGPHEAASLREDDPKRPDSLYGACKLWSEHLAETYNREHGMEIVSLRPCSVFGLGRAWRGSFASGLVRVRGLPHYMALAELAVRGEPITMPPGDQPADWCYAADAAEAWWLVLTAADPPHRAYNLRAEQRPIGDYTAELRRLLPDARIEVGEAPVHVGQLMDNTRIREELGFEPRYTIETGLADYIERIRSAPDVTGR